MIKLYICCLVLIIGSVEVGLDIDMEFHQEVMEIVSYDNTIRSTNISPMLEVEELVDQISQNNLFPVKQEFINEKESAINIPESQKVDTSYPSQWQAVSNSIPHQGIDLDANLQDD